MNPLDKRSAVLTMSCMMLAMAASAQDLQQSYIDAGYTIASLGGITDLPTPYGGLTIRPGEPNTLYIGGAANNAAGAVYTVPLTRDAGTGRITGYGGPATIHRPAPFIDGGLLFAPNGTMLYTRYPEHRLGQTLPSGDSLSIPLYPYSGGCGAGGGLMLVPQGVPGAGNLVIACYLGSGAYLLPYTIDSQGYYVPTVAAAPPVSTWPCSGPEGIAYVPPGSPGFAGPSLLLCSFSQGRVFVFTANDEGLIIEMTGQLMITGLYGAEGATIDPVTGDFLFSTFVPGGGNQVFKVSGFAQPSSFHDAGIRQDRIASSPNPTDGMVKLRCDGAPCRGMVEVRDSVGALVAVHALQGEVTHIDLSALPTGLYGIKAVGVGAAVTKVIVQR